MRIKLVTTFIMLAWAVSIFGQNNKQPVVIILKDGTSYDAVHFGQLKCGKETYGENYIIARGKYMDSPTAIKDYREIEKVVLEGYTDAPAASVGNQKGTLRFTKKNGATVVLNDAELTMSCYAPGDLYNELVVQVLNPLTNKISEQSIEVRNIQSIIFK